MTDAETVEAAKTELRRLIADAEPFAGHWLSSWHDYPAVPLNLPVDRMLALWRADLALLDATPPAADLDETDWYARDAVYDIAVRRARLYVGDLPDDAAGKAGNAVRSPQEGDSGVTTQLEAPTPQNGADGGDE